MKTSQHGHGSYSAVGMRSKSFEIQMPEPRDWPWPGSVEEAAVGGNIWPQELIRRVGWESKGANKRLRHGWQPAKTLATRSRERKQRLSSNFLFKPSLLSKRLLIY